MPATEPPPFDPTDSAGYQPASRFIANNSNHVLQQLRPYVSGYDLRRKPWAGNRLRGRRLPAAHSTDRSRHSTLSRQAPARAIALHHAAPGAGSGQDSVWRVCRRGKRTAGDDRYADRASDRECRPALEGLFRHQGQVPAWSRRLHLRHQIRPARLSRRRPPIGARDGDAGRRRCHRPQDRAGHVGARRAHPDGTAPHRPRPLRLGRSRAQSVFLSGRQNSLPRWKAISTACARQAHRPAR